MSFRSGDRARAHKTNRKRRLKRSLVRVIKQASEAKAAAEPAGL